MIRRLRRARYIWRELPPDLRVTVVIYAVFVTGLCAAFIYIIVTGS